MSKLKSFFTRIAHELDKQADERRRSMRTIDPWKGGTISILTYRSYGTNDELTVAGRVLADSLIEKAKGDESLWHNVARNFRHFNSREVGDAPLKLRYGQIEVDVVSDEEGYFAAEIPLGEPLTSGGWQSVAVEQPDAKVRAEAHVLVPPVDAQFGVISDLDDTVIETNVTEKLDMIKTVLFRNARSRLPFPGVAELYVALQKGSDGKRQNPIFYVSGGPWNLYDIYHDFLDAQGIPAGPILLADFGVGENLLIHPEHQDHKSARIREILETYPELKFVLIGDSGEHDPEIYLDAVRTHPNRVIAIYIRSVGRPGEEARFKSIASDCEKLGVAFVASATADVPAADALTRGLIAR